MSVVTAWSFDYHLCPCAISAWRSEEVLGIRMFNTLFFETASVCVCVCVCVCTRPIIDCKWLICVVARYMSQAGRVLQALVMLTSC